MFGKRFSALMNLPTGPRRRRQSGKGVEVLDRMVIVDDISLPRLIYGTAWKEDKTARWTEMALRAGFRGIDSANQRKHYDEAAVGQGINAVVNYGVVRRDQLFLQSKFTFRASQDYRLPYDPDAPIADQVEQSFAGTCQHLGVEHLDGYLLHGPSMADQLGSADWEAWRAMEQIHQRGAARLLGISNVSLPQLESLVRDSTVPPRIVQNRCNQRNGWDARVRSFCSSNGIVYQGFSVLTGSQALLRRSELVQMAKRLQRTPSQVVIRSALEMGVVVLTGTTSPQHMRHDLDTFDFELAPGWLGRIESLAATEAL
jgi:diketogulonate reductase-like aldo/keto reductase